MAPKSNNPWFVSALVLAVVIFAGECFWVFRSWQAMGKAEVQVKMQQRELIALERLDPSPTEAEAAGIAQQVDGLESIYQDLRSKLKGGRATKFLAAEAGPKERTDAYIDLVAYVRSMQAAAKKHDVKVASDERFGFKSYVNEGPDTALIPVVHRQRQVLQYLLEQLFAAQPQALDAVKRATPGETRGQHSRDGFIMNPALSLKRSDYVDTLAFQIEFRAETAALRQWLNALAKYEVPVMVRAIEVDEPAAQDVANSNLRSQGSLVITGEDSAPITLVARDVRKFTVTLEYVDLVERKPGGAE